MRVFFPSYTASFVCCLVWLEQMLPHMFLLLSWLAAVLKVHALFPRSSSGCWDRDSLPSRNKKKKHFVTVKAIKSVFLLLMLDICVMMHYSRTSGVDTGTRQKLARGSEGCEVHLQRQIQSTGPPLHLDQVSVPKQPKPAVTDRIESLEERTRVPGGI